MTKPRAHLALIFCTMLIVGCATPPEVQPSAIQALPIVTAENIATPIATEMSQPTEAPAEEWQQYTNPDAGFSIDYPAGWTQETLPDQNAGLLKGVALRGPEGSVELYWGVGFGGACPDGYDNIAVAQGELPTCYVKNADGTENWEQIYKQLGDITFGARAFTKNAEPASGEIILATLATLSFAEEATATVTPVLDVSTLCPDETESTASYISTENGVCLLYPAGFEAEPDVMRPDEAVILRGPSLTAGMDRLWVTLNVETNGPAEGLDSAQYAERWMKLSYPGQQDLYPRDLGLTQQEAVIGDTTAQVIGNLPGFSLQRSAFIVANDIKYKITLQPQPQDLPELAEAAQQVWDTVTQSIVFFPPQNTRPVVRPEDVCPAETEDGKLVVSLTGGYCLLHPVDFAPDPEFPVAIIGGPELGPVEGFDSLRASLAVSSYGLGDQSPEQALQPISEQVDHTSVMTTTIGGYPAVIFDFIGGPWRQRNAQILVGDTVYTFVGQPWDADKYPQALPDVELLWQTVSESIAFFDKWQ